jgi:hypothetical protein
VDIRVEVVGEHSGDELRSLREWLVSDSALRGRVHLVTAAPAEGTLGGGLDALTVALGNGGVVTVFATAAVTWLRRRTGRMDIKVTRPDGATVEVSSDVTRPQTPEELRRTTERILELLDAATEEPEG